MIRSCSKSVQLWHHIIYIHSLTCLQFEDTIFKDKPDAGKIKLKAYKINGNKYHAIVSHSNHIFHKFISAITGYIFIFYLVQVSWDDGKNHYVDFITDSEGKIIPLRLDKILLQHHRNP